jgi:hypothetical protein
MRVRAEESAAAAGMKEVTMYESNPVKPAVCRRAPPLAIFLMVVTAFFIGILVFVYVATKRVSPVMLDQQGHPLGQTTQASAKAAH